MGVVECNQYEVGERFDELKVVGIPCKERGKRCKQDLHDVHVRGTSPLFHTSMFVFKLAYVRKVRNYGKSIIYQVQTLLLALNIFQKTDNPLAGMIFKYALQ